MQAFCVVGSSQAVSVVHCHNAQKQDTNVCCGPMCTSLHNDDHFSLILHLHACCPDCSGLAWYRQLYKSVHTQLFSLPDSTFVYPAHDYKSRTSSTILSEKSSNPRLGLSEDKFVELMQNLGLPYPKKIDVAVPANLACGVY